MKRLHPLRPTPDGIRITKVGLWYVLLTLIVAIAASNTGNNALYLVLSVMLGLLIVSGTVSRQNVRKLAATLEPPPEVFAKRPFGLRFSLSHRGRLWSRWLLLVSALPGGAPWLVPFLPRGASAKGELEVALPRRGRHRLRTVAVHSLFPFGLFRKGIRYPVDCEVVVFPELFAAPRTALAERGRLGERPSPRAGWGHDLHALRPFRAGDDPRSIHWKQTAKTGHPIFLEREAEDDRRLAILFDNGVGALTEPRALARFEQLVSEAATSAVHHLARGFEVELITRDTALHFSSGPRHRLALLEALALIEPVAPCPIPLEASDRSTAVLRLGFEEGAA